MLLLALAHLCLGRRKPSDHPVGFAAMPGQRGRSTECLLPRDYCPGRFHHNLVWGTSALFSPDGTILQCRDKSKLIHLLNKLSTIQPLSQEGELPEDGMNTTQDVPSRKITLVDGMVLLQQMTKKPATIVTVKDLSECLNNRLMSFTRDYDEIIFVFDTYRDYSLKSATRDKRRQGRAPIQYQVRDDTNIKHIPMNRFLSQDKTKADLTNYLAAKILEYNSTAQKRVITSSSGHTSSNDDLHFQDNNQLDPLKNGYHKDSCS